MRGTSGRGGVEFRIRSSCMIRTFVGVVERSEMIGLLDNRVWSIGDVGEVE